jgi:serine/threonine-protein phosphatase 2A catalytic subunit
MECQTKYNNTIVWENFTDIFDYIPIAAIVENVIFAVHGGLSPAI